MYSQVQLIATGVAARVDQDFVADNIEAELADQVDQDSKVVEGIQGTPVGPGVGSKVAGHNRPAGQDTDKAGRAWALKAGSDKEAHLQVEHPQEVRKAAHLRTD